MAIKVITGNTFDVVSKSVYDEIAKNSKNGGKHCLIVPDQFALMSEKEVLDYLGLAASFDIEVASFSRLAAKYIKDKTKDALTRKQV